MSGRSGDEGGDAVDGSGKSRQRALLSFPRGVSVARRPRPVEGRLSRETSSANIAHLEILSSLLSLSLSDIHPQRALTDQPRRATAADGHDETSERVLNGETCVCRLARGLPTADGKGRAREIGRGSTVNAATCAGVDGGVSSRATASGPPSRTPRRGRSPPTKNLAFRSSTFSFGSAFANPATVTKNKVFVVDLLASCFEVLARNPQFHWNYVRKIIGFQDKTACVD